MATSIVPEIGLVAVNTSDLGRFRRFYEGILGVRLGVTMRMPLSPYLRHAIFPVQPGLALHVFEVPGYDPEADGIGAEFGRRGRIDHFAFRVDDEAALVQVASRLHAAGASDGNVRARGPFLLVHAIDPDGLQFEVTCTNLAFDAAASPDEVEEIGVTDWVEQVGGARPGG